MARLKQIMLFIVIDVVAAAILELDLLVVGQLEIARAGIAFTCIAVIVDILVAVEQRPAPFRAIAECFLELQRILARPAGRRSHEVLDTFVDDLDLRLAVVGVLVDQTVSRYFSAPFSNEAVFSNP